MSGERISMYLDLEDMKALVNGNSPNYNAFENPLVKKHGYWTGGFVDKWSWDIKNASLTELYELYCICKDSWNK